MMDIDGYLYWISTEISVTYLEFWS